jgi:hypothetical protein
VPTEQKTGMDAFRLVVAEFRGTMLLAVGGSALLPIVAYFGDFDPPWPSGVATITSIATLIVIIFVFQFLWKRAKRSVDRAMLWGAVLLIVAGTAYFTLFDMFVFIIPTTGEHGIAGCGWTTNAKMVASEFLADPADGCPGNYQKLLESVEYEARQLWRPNSLTAVKMALLFSWLALFIGLSLIVAAFVTYQVRKKS